MSRRAVFCDRDGVLIDAVVRHGKPYGIGTVDEMTFCTGAVQGCKALRKAGFAVIVVTNQPEVARGTLSATILERMHEKLRSAITIDGIYVCTHDDDDECSCRKPAPGMLLAAQDEHGIDLTRSYIIGDRWRDIDAGRHAGCATVHLDRHYGERPPGNPDAVVQSFPEAVTWILEREQAVAGDWEGDQNETHQDLR